MRRLWLIAVVLVTTMLWAQQGTPPVPEQTAQNPADAERMAQGAQRAELENQHQLGVNAQPDYAQIPDPHRPQGEEQTVEETHPTLVGCLQQGAGERQFLLIEQRSGTRFRLNGPPEELKNHVNHLVELVGRPANAEETAKAAAGVNEPGFEVSGVQDLAPTCGAGHQR